MKLSIDVGGSSIFIGWIHIMGVLWDLSLEYFFSTKSNSIGRKSAHSADHFSISESFRCCGDRLTGLTVGRVRGRS